MTRPYKSLRRLTPKQKLARRREQMRAYSKRQRAITKAAREEQRSVEGWALSKSASRILAKAGFSSRAEVQSIAFWCSERRVS